MKQPKIKLDMLIKTMANGSCRSTILSTIFPKSQYARLGLILTQMASRLETSTYINKSMKNGTVIVAI